MEGRSTHFADRLADACERGGAPVCVGIDPHIDLIPAAILERSLKCYGSHDDALVEAVSAFTREVLEVVAEAGIRIVKPQIAFFEALGPGGWSVFDALCQRARELGLLVIADIKRGDISSTSEAYAQAWLGGVHLKKFRVRPYAVDAITVNPYLGSDGMTPFITAAAESGRGIFALLKTSNPSSKELQDLKLASGEPLYLEVARLIRQWGATCCNAQGVSLLGAVVGATHPAVAAELRAALPDTTFLVPGYGAQGAGAADLKPFFRRDGSGVIVNSSRGVIHAYGKSEYAGDWRVEVRKAARALIQAIAAVRAS